jgi:hypothetical protein
MKKKILLAFALTFSAGMFFISCGGGENDEHGETTTDSVAVVEKAPETSNEMSYQVPSPGEMLTFIKMVGGKNNKNTTFLNAPDNKTKYVDAKSKALNFGIYSCDLSYCSVFEIGMDVLKYFKVVKQLGDEIGVASTISPDVLKRLENNAGNPDSLAMISDDLYYSSFETLQNSDHGNTLALVVAGGYIESLFIVTNLVKYDAKSPAIERLADQKLTLDNIIEFMKKYQSDADVASVIPALSELKTLFDQITEKEAAKVDAKGKNVLGGGTTLEMSSEQYKTISEKIKSVRNEFSQNK